MLTWIFLGMRIRVKGSDLKQDNPVAYRIWKDTGIDQHYIEFTQKVITFRKDDITILATLKNTKCLERIWKDITEGRSPKKCSFEISDSIIMWVLYGLDPTLDWYGFDWLDYSN